LLRRSYPASTLLRPCPTPARGLHLEDGVEVRTLAQSGSPPITRAALPTCRVHYPDGPNGCMCRLLPRSRDLPRIPGGSASILELSRPAQTSLALRPAGSLSRPRRPLSRGSGPASHPAKPLVSYQINRQLSGWNLPPLATRAFGAHVESRKGAVALRHSQWPRFPSPLIKPDVRIYRIRLSDWLRRKAHDGEPVCLRFRHGRPPSPCDRALSDGSGTDWAF